MYKLKLASVLLFFAAFAVIAKGQQTITVNETLAWKIVSSKKEQTTDTWFTFDNATAQNVASRAPVYTYSSQHGYPAQISVALENVVQADITPAEMAALGSNITAPTVITPSVFYYTLNRQPAAHVTFVPLITDAQTGALKKIISFTLKLTYTPQLVAAKSGTYQWAEKSVLATGKWARIHINTNGIYKLDVNYLEKAGLAVNGADISSIRLYGNGGAPLPQPNDAPKNDDLVENPVEIKDINQNGKFDGSDYLLFYGEGTGAWDYTGGTGLYKRNPHRYADENYYYVTIGQPGGKRIAVQATQPGSATYTTTTFDEFFYHEKELTNLVKSGREWYGEEFDRVTSYDFTVDIPDFVSTDSVRLSMSAVGRSQVATSFPVTCNGNILFNHSVRGINYDAEYPFIDTPDTTIRAFMVNSAPLNIRVAFNKSEASIGWLAFFTVVVRRQLHTEGSQLIFRDNRTIGQSLSQFSINSGGQALKVWDITNPLEPKDQQIQTSGQQVNFALATPTLKTFIAFSEGSAGTPAGYSQVENQNLHALKDINMVFVVHPNFWDQAEQLAEFHRTHDGLTVALVTPDQLYHEFSSGKQDVTAIRNFMKMLYDKPASPGKEIKYLLMFGDASYDYKNRVKNNTNLVPTYQSYNSYSPTASYCSDDYFVQLDDNEGAWWETRLYNETVDLGVGRLPVNTKEQAQQVVDKIIYYTTNKTLGDWRNNVCFFADDEDYYQHFNDAQSISSIVENNYKNYNVEKIYLDAYKQISVGSGERYPEVNDLFNRKVAKGALIINYNGHGGEQGLAHEQILSVPMINDWTNKNNMPLFVTATCEFSRFDDPARTSAGELVLLNPNGGGIGLLTTVRLVFSSGNKAINAAFYDNNVFTPYNGKTPRLGDVFMRSKNNALELNNRNFTLLGDPALTLAYPTHKIVTTEINGVNTAGNNADTVAALGKITIKGEVQDAGGNKLSSFNGTLYPTVFDKKSVLTTLDNDNDGKNKVPFSVYKSIIYKGKASVKNGEFEFTFIVPKDISYVPGNGKISYYAENKTEDANGYYDSVIITGTDKTAAVDITGPAIQLYMNDTNFRSGGITNQNPTLLALVSDLHGINTTGNGIGRDLTAIMDGDRNNTLILNDYYEAKLDSYQDGEIRFPLYNLSEGRHNIRVKVWDVYNNSAEGYTEFVVANSEKLAIKHLINYPNPFSQKTTFYFEHNRQGSDLSVEVQIYSMTGQLIKTMNAEITNAESNVDGLEWNAEGDFGNNLAQGIYLFRVKVRSGNDTVEETEKMVFIK